MEVDSGKLFIGGISWETNENRLREYFGQFGEIVEAVIMRDRITGRARGFGFIVFADPGVAVLVTAEKHMIDGRMVEAKKAVPRDDQSIAGKTNSGSIGSIGSPGPGRTRKIFVGGLPSSITEPEFRRYFEQFGPVADVVVMYDHNTQRPRGFGFITYNSEDSVEKALHKTFHEFNGKMVEVKKAIPKELSPGPNLRSPLIVSGGSVSRQTASMNGYSPGYNPNAVDSRFGLFRCTSANGFSTPGIGHGIGLDNQIGSNFIGSSNFDSSNVYERRSAPCFRGDFGRFNGLGEDPRTVINSIQWNGWEDGGAIYSNNPATLNSPIAPGTGRLGGFGNGSASWGGSSVPSTDLGGISGYAMENLSQVIAESSFGLHPGNFKRSSGSTIANPYLDAPGDGYEGRSSVLDYQFGRGGFSFYNDATWRFSSSELDGPDLFSYELGTTPREVKSTPSGSYYEGNYTGFTS